MKNKKIITLITSLIIALAIMTGVFIGYKDTGKIDENKIDQAVNILVEGLKTYSMAEAEIEDLPTTEIVEITNEEEIKAGEEQATTETEGFELQGEIAYNGTSEYPQISLGDYVGLTYYSQIDSRWRYLPYTSVGNSSQTIGSSGCGPTSAAMIVTAIKGTITPDKMSSLFVDYGYRSADNGTYFSAFRWVADTFDIEYTETYYTDTAMDLLGNNHYVVVSVGNGLFTTGGHFIVLTGINGNTISIYDPYLYAGKFDTSTRRGKVEVYGNTVYCSVDNFREYANPSKYFAFKYETKREENNAKEVTTSTYTRYVRVNTSLNVRDYPNGTITGSLYNGDKVTVYETSANWSRIGDGRWVCSDYLVEAIPIANKTNIENTVGNYYRFKSDCNIYSNPDLTGTVYDYLAKTQIKVLENVSSSIDKIYVIKTGRIGYINKSAYMLTNTTSNASSTVGNYYRFRDMTYIYQYSNLTGIVYTYLPQTQIKVLENVSDSVDKIYVIKTGRIGYVRKNSYK